MGPSLIYTPRANRRPSPACSLRTSILLVTDDSALAAACSHVLEREGYGVTYAAHSGHALLACLSGRAMDVLLTELSMEDGSGPALAQRLRRHRPELATVYVAQPGTLYEDGSILVRPFTSADLLDRIAEACRAPRVSSSPAS
jgi:two-component system, cell cycle sensor histidine kinase and response regulator CckA